MRRLAAVVVLAAVGITIYWWQSQPPPATVRGRGQETKVEQARLVFQGKELVRQELLGGLAFMTGAGFPGTVPWGPLDRVAKEGVFPLEILLHYHPVLFLEECQARYKENVEGYTCTFYKQERVKGKLLNADKISIHFCDEPFSVHMHFLETAGRAHKVVYPDRGDRFKLAARGKGLGVTLPFIMTKDINSPDAKESSRFPINEFGIYKGTESTIASMRRAQARGELHVRYEGVFKVPELGDRECYKLVRTPYNPPELEGIYEYTLYIDKELLLQTGSVLRDSKGELIAQYWFSDVKLNPEFKDDQFTRNAL
ncbi:MAG: DUF1571 domain-containing protein [Gemmataceae bacterium]|nr:DUF1571 domain-containing protein [Gemmataceae bacterium]